MKRHVAILAAGALTLTAGLVVTIETGGDALAAMRSFRTFSAPRTNFQVSRQRFSTQRFSTQRLSTRKFTTTRRLTTKKFTTKHLNVTKFSTSRRNFKFSKQNFNTSKTKFSSFPKGVKGPKGLTSFGPKSFKKGPIGISLGPKSLKFKGPIASLGPAKLFPKGPKLTLINNHNFTIWRGPRGIWWNGRLRNLVALSLLGGVTIGGVYYLADGYVPIAYPVCRGITEEGCSLVWREVPTDDGSLIAQCVQFCPGPPPAVSTEAPPGPATTAVPTAPATDAPPATPPAPVANAPTVAPAGPDTRTAAAPVPPGAMAQGCDMTIHGDLNFAGVASEVTADQPQLSTYGWDRAISSIQVKSGTWDFYTEDNYGGQMIRLAPGQYPKLVQGWDKTINSLMCSQP